MGVLISEKVQGLLDKLAMEIVMAEPGSDQGQFPILDLLGNVRDESTGNAVIVRFHEFARNAADDMATLVETGKPFTAEDLEWLNQVLLQMKNLLQDPDAPLSPASALRPGPRSAADQGFPGGRPRAGEQTVATPPPLSLKAEIPLTMDVEQDRELLLEFIHESHEHLDNIERGVLVLEENPDDNDTLNSIFRAFHTFKGGSGFLSLTPINRLAHELESLLDLVREQKLLITPDVINLILRGGDALKQFITEMELQLGGIKPLKSFTVPTEELKAQVVSVIQSAVEEETIASPPPANVVPADTNQTARTPEPLAETAIHPPLCPVNEERETEQADDELDGKSARSEGAAASRKTGATEDDGKTGAPSGLKSAHAQIQTLVKVDIRKLDSLVDMVGEMVIAHSLIAQDSNIRNLNDQMLSRNLAQLGRIVNELEKTAMAMRMVPIRSTFQKMARLIRDLAARTQKQAQLTMEGEDTELDRTIVEEFTDPLMHMVRNSVDHGIEKPEIRLAAGKPAQGTIHLRAFHQGGSIVIQVKDDGAGLNKERIFAKAVEKGLIAADARLSDRDIFAFIFAAGFSTAEKVTDISGRGVGMDVVKANIEKLRGTVEMDSEIGKGTTFTVYFPLTLAIIDGLIVTVGEQRYIIPTLSVRESFRPTAGMISTIHETAEVVNVRGRLVPLLRLYECLGIPSKATDPAQAIIVVLESGYEQRCVLVDDLIGKQEVVIKSLGESFKQNDLLAGAAILGDGRVGLILNPTVLVQLKRVPTLKAA
ncbi:MAG: chemotaxis protein CheW [Verrucomicrobia bacterium]|nr:chemotaxis protein CheW [Verrucomicrobiota bacterium]